MPQLGETVTEGTVAQWLKKVGDSVEKYEAFVEISTDKVNAEVPSPVSGTISQIIVEAGDTVPTGAPIAIIEESVAASAEPSAAPETPVASSAAPLSAVASSPSVPASYGAPANSAPANGAAAANGMAANGAPTHASGTPAAANGTAGRNGHAAASASPPATRRTSPAVRRLAREYHVDLDSLRGSGSAGRVTAQDVIAAGAAATEPVPQAAPVTYAAPLTQDSPRTQEAPRPSDVPHPRRAGVLERAHGGTLLLDEVSDMPLETQGKIVRALQDQTFERLGGSSRVKVDVRVLSTTNRDLQAEIARRAASARTSITASRSFR